LVAESLKDELFRLTLHISNVSAVPGAESLNRDAALLHSLISTHAILHTVDGEFVSLLDPPPALRSVAQACENKGVWPVLVGEEGDSHTMLASPIILYDYPQVAPESPGDLFDGAEIDEILSLRILTMTDDEKHEMRHADERARQILERTENLPEEQLRKLHGALRSLRAMKGELS
jgi:hydrogenase maturation protease